MSNPLLAALSGEEILQSSLSAVVTTDYIVVNQRSSKSHTIISLECLSEIRTIKTTHPGLLVIAAGALLIAAAAYCSKEGDGAALPAFLVGLAFVIGYFVSQRANIAFVVDAEVTETASGSLRAAGALVKAVTMARTKQGYMVAKRSRQGVSSRQWIQRVLSFSYLGRA